MRLDKWNRLAIMVTLYIFASLFCFGKAVVDRRDKQSKGQQFQLPSDRTNTTSMAGRSEALGRNNLPRRPTNVTAVDPNEIVTNNWIWGDSELQSHLKVMPWAQHAHELIKAMQGKDLTSASWAVPWVLADLATFDGLLGGTVLIETYDRFVPVYEKWCDENGAVYKDDNAVVAYCLVSMGVAELANQGIQGAKAYAQAWSWAQILQSLLGLTVTGGIATLFTLPSKVSEFKKNARAWYNLVGSILPGSATALFQAAELVDKHSIIVEDKGKFDPTDMVVIRQALQLAIWIGERSHLYKAIKGAATYMGSKITTDDRLIVRSHLRASVLDLNKETEADLIAALDAFRALDDDARLNPAGAWRSNPVLVSGMLELCHKGYISDSFKRELTGLNSKFTGRRTTTPPAKDLQSALDAIGRGSAISDSVSVVSGRGSAATLTTPRHFGSLDDDDWQ